MLLILCPLDDLDTLAFARRSTAEGADCRIATTEALSFARRRSHRLSTADARSPRGTTVSTAIEMAGGQALLGAQGTTGVLNRMIEPPAAAWRRAATTERDYAVAELHAFTLSWLAGLRCPIRNRPTPGCLAGPAPHPLTVLAAGRAVGLDCAPISWDSRTVSTAADLLGSACRAAGPAARTREVICLDATVVSAEVPRRVAVALTKVAEMIGVADALIGAHFAVSGARWVFAGITPLPSLGRAEAQVRRAVLGVLGARPAAAEVAG